MASEDEGLPKVEMEFADLGKRSEQGRLAFLSLVDAGSEMIASVLVAEKAANAYIVAFVVEFTGSLGRERAVLRSDQEPTLLSPARKVRKTRARP
eukprot:10802769-Alexandrium_andersonii.AAC.1